MFIDLTPNVARVCADRADRQGNLYTGANTEDTPAIVEAAAFRHGIVIAQVNDITDALPRVDIPGSWVDFIVQADRPFAILPLFTRDPRLIGELQILMGMMIIRGIYERHGVMSLNHGIGFDTAAIELLLPTYGDSLGLKGKICRNWALNPHPTLIPAIESGWVESVHSFGSEVGMEELHPRPGRTRFLRRGRRQSAFQPRFLSTGRTVRRRPVHRLHAANGLRRQFINGDPRSLGRVRRRPEHGQRPARPTAHQQTLARSAHLVGSCDRACGRKLVVQTVETFKKGGEPAFVETLDAVEVGKRSGMPIAPVMIYGDDVTHVVTEEGIAYLYKVQGAERRHALAAVAGATELEPRGPIRTGQPSCGRAASSPIRRIWA